jgi:hypothetical protein
MNTIPLATTAQTLVERIELKAAEFHATNGGDTLLTMCQVEHLRILTLAIVISQIRNEVADDLGRRLEDLLFPGDVADEPCTSSPTPTDQAGAFFDFLLASVAGRPAEQVR